MKAIELLSPAGAYPILKAVIGAGADAVYVGGPAFGARAYADNFSKEELLESIALREDTTPEQMIEELSQRYDLPESMLLESAADLAALLQIKEKYLLLGCGRIAAPEDNPQQILLAQAAPGKTEKVTATLQKRLETVQRAFPGYPSAQAGRVITAGDYALLVIVTADDMDTVQQEIMDYFIGGK